MTELDVINDMLATMGISPLNQLDDNNPDVANGRRILASQSETIQSRGWWFNKEQIELFPDALSGYIYLPGDAIVCDPVIREPLLPITERDGRLYDTDKNTFVFTGNKPVTCWIVRNIPFKNLPPSAQRVIGLASVRKFQQSYDADPQKMARIDQEYVVANAMLMAEHTRNIRPNLLYKSSSLRELSRINGNSYRRW